MTLTSYTRNSLTVAIISAVILAAYFWDRKDERTGGDVPHYVAQQDVSIAWQSPQLETTSVEISQTVEIPNSYLVQAASLEAASRLVADVGGEVTADLKIIKAVAALLTDSQLQTLRAHSQIVRVWEDRELTTSGKKSKQKKTSVETQKTSV